MCLELFTTLQVLALAIIPSEGEISEFTQWTPRTSGCAHDC